METLILDTDVIVDFLRSDAKVVEMMRELKEKYKLATTDINAFELYRGAYKSGKQEKNLAATKGFLGRLILISTNENSMEIAAKISVGLQKKGKTIEIRDLFIGAMCITNSFKLLTRNLKHFQTIEGLRIAEVER